MIDYPPLPVPETRVDKPKVEKDISDSTKLKLLLAFGVILISGVIYLGTMENTGTSCEAQIQNATLNGTLQGIDFTLYRLTESATKCEAMPIQYKDISYSLIPIECLNLNNTGGNQNGNR